MATEKVQEKPKRLSLSEVLGMVLARGHERSSVSLTRNAKGETQIEVVARTAEGESVADAEQRAGEVYDRLLAKYGGAGGEIAGGGSVTLTRNAKGETQIEVVARTAEGEDVQAAEKVALETFDRIRRTHPMSSGYVGAAPESGTPVSPQEEGNGGGKA